MNNTFKIIVVDDHEIFRRGVMMSISSIEGVETLAEASNGLEVVKLVKNGMVPDAIFMDIKMPKMDGIQATEEVLKLQPHICVVAFSMFGDEAYLEKMINAGAKGFILKNTDAEGLRSAIETMRNGGQYYSEEFLSYFTQKYISNKNKNEEAVLSKRELEVLELISKGYTNQEMSAKLFISPKTVANHRAKLLSKTGSKNTITLLGYAIKNKLITI